MLDATTITDEQIRELRDEAKNWREHTGPAPDWQVWSDCDLALARIPARASDRDTRIAKRNAARARCAEIWNARAAKGGAK